MKRDRWWRRAIRLGIVLVLLAGFVAARAEVQIRVVGNDLKHVLIMAAIIEDPDPVGVTIWELVDLDSDCLVLNPDGAVRGDGRPDIAVSFDLNRLLASWAWNAGTDYDIVVTEWRDGALSEPVFLTSEAHDEIDPRVFIEADGSAHVTWWTPAPDERVFVASRPAESSTWGLPEQVTPTGVSGRRPSVVVRGGVMRVAYESGASGPGMSQSVVVARRDGGGGFTTEWSVETARSEQLDPQLHLEDGRLWLDWKHESGEFGRAEASETGWSLEATEPWNDPSWVGVESVRRAIRDRVLGP
jgi:hypothetical protein